MLMIEYPKRVTDVNRMLREKGYPEYKLARGRGYFYFYGGDTSSWHNTGVYVFSLSDLTLQGWFQAFKDLKEGN